MRIECPSCHFSAEVDPARIPPQGASTKCPKCSEVFLVTPPMGEPEKVTCPKCGAEQDNPESCDLCGIVFEKFRAAEKRRQLAASVTKAEPVSCDAPVPAGSPGSQPFGYGRGELMAWVGEGHLSAQDLPDALGIAGTLPSPASWRRFLDGLALWLGAVFLAAAVIFFFAYNWKELGHLARFGIAESLLVAAVIAAWRLGLDRMSGKAALLTATLLVGALLALIGQTYQTGADPWELFATWALLVVPWVAISRFSPLWLFLLALVNLAAGLYCQTFAGVFGILFGAQTLWWTLSGVNTAALVVWELAAARGAPWLAERWAHRIVATSAAGFITLQAFWGIVGRESAGLLELCAYSAWLVCAHAIYRHRVRDLYVLALGVLSLVSVVAVFLGHTLLQGGGAGAFLCIGIAVLGMSAAGGRWLRQVAREVDA